MPYLFDILIIAVLALFAWRGAAKGLILSLCGLAAVFVAFFAAQFVSDTFCQPVANIIRPIIVQSFSELVPDDPLTVVEVGPNQSTVGYSYTLDDLLDSIQKEGLFKGFSAFLEGDAAKDAIQTSAHTSPLDALTSYLAKAVARTLLFGIVFSIGWTPCVGAFLGSALLLASQQGSAITGIIMLLCYSAGLGVPFVASALLIDKLKGAFAAIKRHYDTITKVCGWLLVAIGIAMATGVLGSLLTFLA